MRILQGRVAIREELPKAYGAIVVPDDYHEKHERDRGSHRGRVLGLGPPATTKRGAPVDPGFGAGDEVVFIFDRDASNGLGPSTEKGRKGVWPIDGGPCVWVAQEEVIAVVEQA